MSFPISARQEPQFVPAEVAAPTADADSGADDDIPAGSPLSEEDLTAHQRETRQLVRAMMSLTQQSASGLALSAGLTPSTVNRFMHKPVRHTLSQRTMLALLTETFLHLKVLPRENWDYGALADLIPALAVYEQGILELAPDIDAVLKQVRADNGERMRDPCVAMQLDWKHN